MGCPLSVCSGKEDARDEPAEELAVERTQWAQARLAAGDPHELVEGRRKQRLAEASAATAGEATEAVGFHADYLLTGRIGSGDFSQVHIGVCARTRREVAVKIASLTDDHKLGNPGASVNVVALETVKREADLLGMLKGDNRFVQLQSHFIEDNVSYLAMELCDLTLNQALRLLGAVDSQVYRRLFLQMSECLHGLHDLKIVHRDIKPDNFMCCVSEQSGVASDIMDVRIKLCDFGLSAKMIDKRIPLKTQCGTAPYMSPDMLATGAYGLPTDMWSIGCVMYCLIYGKFPYTPGETKKKAMKEIIRQGLPPPDYRVKEGIYLEGEVPIELSAIEPLLQGLLNREPAERLTAEEAKQHPWFSESPMPMLRSMKPSLRSAERAGAFTLSRKKVTAKIDNHILSKQVAANGIRGALCNIRRSTSAKESIPFGQSYSDEMSEDQDSVHMYASHSTTDTTSTTGTTRSARSSSIRMRFA